MQTINVDRNGTEWADTVGAAALWVSLDAPADAPTADMTLDQLAAIANNEHAAVETAMSEVLRHAIAAGDALRIVRERLRHGDVDAWLATNFVANRSKAFLYIRLSHHQELVLQSGAKSLRSAKAFMSAEGLVSPRLDTDVRNEGIRSLRAAGMTYRAIAELYEVSPATVQRVGSGARKKYEQNRKRAAERRQAQAALRMQQRRTLAKRAGGDISSAYSQLRVLAETLERAAAAADNQETRKAIRAAQSNLYHVEDEIVRASKAAV